MAIQLISRDWGPNPCIVRMVTTDNLATISAEGYITAQASNINSANFGAFQWQDTDLVLVSYSGGIAFFTYDSTNDVLLANNTIYSTSVAVTSAQLKALYGTPLQMVAAGGANTILVPQSIFVEYIFDTAQYTAGGAMGLQYGSTVHAGGTAASATIAAATFNGYAASEGFTLAPAATGAMSAMVNKGLYLAVATQDFATGSGALVVNIDYKLIPTVS